MANEGIDLSAEEPAPADGGNGLVHCVHCNYDLRGLPANGRCPECGNPVADSTAPHLLVYADPRWVRKLGLGTLLACCVLCVWLLSFGLGFMRTRGLLLPNPRTLLMIWSGIYLIVLPLQPLAAWLLTTPEPGVAEYDHITFRYFIRWATVVSSAAQLVIVSRIFLQWEPPSFRYYYYFYVAADAFFSGVLILIAVRVKSLAVRLPARRAGTILVWAGGILAIRSALPLLLELVATRGGNDPLVSERIVYVVRTAAWIATPLGSIVGLCVLPGLVSRFRRAARAREANAVSVVAE